MNLNFPTLFCSRFPRSEDKRAGNSKFFLLFFTLFFYIPWVNHFIVCCTSNLNWSLNLHFDVFFISTPFNFFALTEYDFITQKNVMWNTISNTVNSDDVIFIDHTGAAENCLTSSSKFFLEVEQTKLKKLDK